MGCYSSKDAAATAEPEIVDAAVQRAGGNTLLSAPASREGKKAVGEKKEGLTQVAQVLSGKMQQHAQDIFMLADEDGKGYIDMSDFAKMRSDVRFKEVMRRFEDVDADGNHDGKLSLEEWLAYINAVDYREDQVPQGWQKSEAHRRATEDLLNLYEKYIRLWVVKSEAESFFKMADKDGKGYIKVCPHLSSIEGSVGSNQLSKVLSQENNAPYGNLSLPQWLDYIEKVHMSASHSGTTGRYLLKLCKKDIDKFSA